jgi:hypothetical protein
MHYPTLRPDKALKVPMRSGDPGGLRNFVILMFSMRVTFTLILLGNLCSLEADAQLLSGAMTSALSQIPVCAVQSRTPNDI